MQAIARLVVLVVALGVAACATTPSANFFTLNPADVEPQVARSDLSLALGPIDLPGYLDRPQIVTRAGVTDLDRYAVDPGSSLQPDFFV